MEKYYLASWASWVEGAKASRCSQYPIHEIPPESPPPEILPPLRLRLKPFITRSCAKYDSMIRSVHINCLNHIDTVWTGMPLTILALLELFRRFSHSSARYTAYRSLFALEMIGISPKTTVVEWSTSRCDYHHIKAVLHTIRPNTTAKQSWSSLDVG